MRVYGKITLILEGIALAQSEKDKNPRKAKSVSVTIPIFLVPQDVGHADIRTWR